MSRRQPLTVALVSLGCPKNLVDSEVMLGRLAEAGCIVGAPMDEADVILINTCGFLSAARDESLEFISEAVGYKRTGRARRVVVAGCLCSRDGRGLYKLNPEIDAVVGVNNRDEILAAVTGKRRYTRVRRDPRSISSDMGRFRLTPRHTGYLRISEGCSQECTFCTIPAIRGPLRSKPPRIVLTDARELIADGAVELNVIAQDTTSYGRDLDKKTHLGSLLRLLDSLEGARWIRLLYTYPKHFTTALIDAIAECERVVPYVDLPLQHISDPILRRMRRGVSRKRVETLLQKLRDRIDGLVLRTTFMVGFPGETERDFEELVQFVKDCRFDAAGVFEFSPEEGTPAAEFPKQVPDDVKAERAEALMSTQQKIAFTANRRMVGKPIEVLVDGIDPDGCCVGRCHGQAPDIDGICYLTEPRAAGSFVQGNVADFDGYDLIVEGE